MPSKQPVKPRILFLGMRNELSRSALDSILFYDVDICAVIIADQYKTPQVTGDEAQLRPPEFISELPLVKRFLRQDISHIAFDRDIAVRAVSDDEIEGLRRAIQLHKPDVVCVACFPKRLPKDVLDMVRLGFLNLHPSILPYHKGPAPLFWIFRSGDRNAGGVTIHTMNEGLDTGDIVHQEKVSFPTGISGIEAERLCGGVGGNLFALAIDGLHTNSIPVKTQSNEGSYESWPQDSDFRLNLSWDAERAFRFMRGTAHWNHVFYVELDQVQYQLTEALGYDDENWLDESMQEIKSSIYIRFRSGVLEALKL